MLLIVLLAFNFLDLFIELQFSTGTTFINFDLRLASALSTHKNGYIVKVTVRMRYLHDISSPSPVGKYLEYSSETV